MKAALPLIVYTSDLTSPQALAWAKQYESKTCPVEVRPLNQLGTVIITPAAPAPKSL